MEPLDRTAPPHLSGHVSLSTQPAVNNPDDDVKFGLVKRKQKNAASVLCEECSDLFCYECFIELHRKGKRQHHICLSINDDGQLVRAGEILPPEEGQQLVHSETVGAQ